ncbi:hypothetical protein PT015_22005 [Candidatus Mycobacterium wuenschmannii]|uniref:Uncharacterized protein n=1 Tax=Candidatus Mycobacterium wuenschmannii TaxID=3027808 RepID=A0ABY8VVD8_9MYCO|nr:hypothetical protein [Candidatus Mycobacterium wuenschmannii]WIM87482.1 hypothetical protein PT015_22005 [Candidatus Mycobacterium wuenschmannii]
MSWAVLIAIGALLAAFHSWRTEQPAPSNEAAPPVQPTLTMPVWLGQSQQSIDGLVTARNNIAAAASRQDIPATGAACRIAGDAVAQLREHMPSPEPAVNLLLQQAISSYTLGLPDCISASHNIDGEGMQRAASFISYGDKSMQSALDLLGAETDGPPNGLGVLIV